MNEIIDQQRNRIDEVDKLLIDLLSERFDAARIIGGSAAGPPGVPGADGGGRRGEPSSAQRIRTIHMAAW